MVFISADLSFNENGTLDDVTYNIGDGSNKVIIGTQVSSGGWDFPGHGYWVSDRAFACDMRPYWGGWWVAYFYDVTGYVDVTFVADNPNNEYLTYDPYYIPTEDQIKYKSFNNSAYGTHRLSFVAPVSGVINYSLPYSQEWTHNTPWTGTLQSNYTNKIDWYSVQIIQKSTDIERFFGYVSVNDYTKVIQQFYNAKNMGVNIITGINKFFYEPISDATGTITINGNIFNKLDRNMPEIIIQNIPGLESYGATEWKITWVSIDGTYVRALSYKDVNSIWHEVPTLFNFTITSISDPSCFNEGTKILCLNNNFEEEYIPIEDLQKGDLVKSYKHGYRKIDLIGNNPMINNPENFCGCMYKMEKTDDNGLTEDLILTGGHSILVDDLGSFKEENDKLFGSTQMIDDKYLLLSAVSDQFVKLDNTDPYIYYHFILENNGNDDDDRFGVWANGILVETPTKKQFTNHVCY